MSSDRPTILFSRFPEAKRKGLYNVVASQFGDKKKSDIGLKIGNKTLPSSIIRVKKESYTAIDTSGYGFFNMGDLGFLKLLSPLRSPPIIVIFISATVIKKNGWKISLISFITSARKRKSRIFAFVGKTKTTKMKDVETVASAIKKLKVPVYTWKLAVPSFVICSNAQDIMDVILKETEQRQKMMEEVLSQEESLSDILRAAKKFENDTSAASKNLQKVLENQQELMDITEDTSSLNESNGMVKTKRRNFLSKLFSLFQQPEKPKRETDDKKKSAQRKSSRFSNRSSKKDKLSNKKNKINKGYGGRAEAAVAPAASIVPSRPEISLKAEEKKTTADNKINMLKTLIPELSRSSSSEQFADSERRRRRRRSLEMVDRESTSDHKVGLDRIQVGDSKDTRNLKKETKVINKSSDDDFSIDDIEEDETETETKKNKEILSIRSRTSITGGPTRDDSDDAQDCWGSGGGIPSAPKPPGNIEAGDAFFTAPSIGGAPPPPSPGIAGSVGHSRKPSVKRKPSKMKKIEELKKKQVAFGAVAFGAAINQDSDYDNLNAKDMKEETKNQIANYNTPKPVKEIEARERAEAEKVRSKREIEARKRAEAEYIEARKRAEAEKERKKREDDYENLSSRDMLKQTVEDPYTVLDEDDMLKKLVESKGSDYVGAIIAETANRRLNSYDDALLAMREDSKGSDYAGAIIAKSENRRLNSYEDALLAIGKQSKGSEYTGAIVAKSENRRLSSHDNALLAMGKVESKRPAKPYKLNARKSKVDFDSVRFSASGPVSVSAGMDFEIDFWAYIRAKYTEVLEAIKAKGHREKAASDKFYRVERGCVMTMTLNLKDPLQIIGDKTKRITWNGKSCKCGFKVHARDGCSPGLVACAAKILFKYTVIDIKFGIKIEKIASGAPAPLKINQTQKPLRVERIPTGLVKLKKKIGEGFFGKVFLGSYNNEDVVVKFLKLAKGPGAATKLDKENRHALEQFKAEIALCQLLGEHPNVCEFKGSVESGGELGIVSKFYKHGSVEDFSKKTIYDPSPQNSLTDLDKLKIARDSCVGLSHIHQAGVLHRDFATRNCLLDEDKSAHVTDFGLSVLKHSAAVDHVQTKNIKIPIKILAPESITYGIYNEKSDAWMAGTYIWELFSNAKPFPGMSARQAGKYVSGGGHLPLEKNLSAPIRSILKNCFKHKPTARSSIEDIITDLDKMIAEYQTLSLFGQTAKQGLHFGVAPPRRSKHIARDSCSSVTDEYGKYTYNHL